MMIRVARDVKRGPYRTKYDPEALTEAFKAVVEKGLPVQRAAIKFGVPISTLKDRVKGRVDIDVVKSWPLPLFNLDQEALLFEHLDSMAQLGYGYSRVETLNLASDYAIHLGLRDLQNPVSLQWLHNFLDRWPNLKVRKPRSLEAARARSATRQVIDKYFNELYEILKRYNFFGRPRAIFNIDEKGLTVNHKPPKIVSGDSYKLQAVVSGKSKTVTIIGGGNALGQQIPPFFIFPGKRMVEGLFEGATPGATGTLSESGWSNSTVFKQYIQDHVSKYLPDHDDKSPILILYDGHKSHISIELIEWAKKNHIILFVLPPHCSHLLQPLDVSCYGPFETTWNSACHRYLRESGGHVITRFDVCKMACKVYTATLSPSNIQAAFKKCGIFPYDPTVISDSIIAPSLSFIHPTSNNPETVVSASQVSEEKSSNNKNQEVIDVPSSSGDREFSDKCERNCVNISTPGPSGDREFLDSRGGKVLQNIKTTKVRNTLSKVVAGKPITDEHVLQQIKIHMQTQSSHSRKRKSSPKPSTSACGNKDNAAGEEKSVRFVKKQAPVQESSFTDIDTDSDDPDEEKCCICNKFYPAQINGLDYIMIVNWGKCDKCGRWVHLQFCTDVRVIRRNANFYCPDCDKN